MAKDVSRDNTVATGPLFCVKTVSSASSLQTLVHCAETLQYYRAVIEEDNGMDITQPQHPPPSENS